MFAEMYRLFPRGVYAERAAWKAGWWAYKNGEYAETVRIFESAAVDIPARGLPAVVAVLDGAVAPGDEGARGRRSRLPPGHRRLSQLLLRAAGDAPRSSACSRRHGRRARGPSRRHDARCRRRSSRACRRRTRSLIRALLAAGLYDDAMLEVRKIQRVSGTSPLLDATMAYALNRKGELRPGDQPDAARVSAVHGARRRGAADADPRGDFPGGPLGPHHEVRGAAQARSVPHDGAHRAGIDVPGRRAIGGECLRSDADPAGDRPPVCAVARDPAVPDGAAHRGRNERPDRHGVFFGPAADVRTRRAGARRLQRRRTPGVPMAGRAARASIRTSSSTTFRSPKRRTT